MLAPNDTQPNPNRKKRSWIIFFVLICITVFLRIYRLSETLRFFDDQGMDMIILWHMEHMNHLPLVGPFLSLSNIFTPPTYYYITWFFYHITGSITGIAYGYFILNIIGIGTLIKLAWDIGGQKTGLSMAILLSISAVMVDHGRQFWQPYPMQVFLSLWLLFVWHAYTSKRVILLWIGITCFQIAFSVYPSPALLLICVGYQIYNWYHKNQSNPSILRSLLQSLITFVSTFCIVFLPQIWFEITHHFPTWNTLITLVPTNTGISHPLLHIGQNVYGLFASFFATASLPSFFMPFFTIVIVIFTYIFVTSRAINTKLSPLFTPWTIFAGLFLLLLYPYDIHPHRMWTFLPLLFLIFALMITHAFSKISYLTYGITLLLCIYITTNIIMVTSYIRTTPSKSMQSSAMIAHAIQNDMTKRDITQTSVGLFYKIPNDLKNGSYGIYKIAYWLLTSNTFTLPLTSNGNMMQLDYSNPVFTPYMYIVCEGFLSSKSAYKQCVQPTIQQYPYKTLDIITIDTSSIFVLFTDVLSLQTPVQNE